MSPAVDSLQESVKNNIKLFLYASSSSVYGTNDKTEFCETDDCIAFYVQNSPKENKIIYSSDGDLTQLVSESVVIYNPSHQKEYKSKDVYRFDNEDVLIENVRLIKTICGDSSDNIAGIRNLGIKKFISFFPEIKNEVLSINDIIIKGNLILKENKENKTIQNLLTGVTKHGVFGDEFFQINNTIVSLEQPFLTEEAKETIKQLINDEIDPTGRSYKNTMKMMMEDGIFNALPKSDDAWINFLNPFLRLTRKEKKKYESNK